MNFLEIDGSVLEGGGQILRNALSLSCIMRRPIRITQIRAGRPKPGLGIQHLYGVNLLQEITKGKVLGNSIGSTCIEFYPGEIHSGKYYADTKTAASTSLLLQVALPVLLYGKNTSQLELKGGTNASMAPPVDFVTEILRPNLERFGATFDFDLLRRGYFPKGGGHCIFTIPAVKKLNSIEITEFGSIRDIFGWSYVAGTLPPKFAEEMKNGALEVLRNVCPSEKCSIEAYKESQAIARDAGSGIILGATTTTGCILGSSALGERKVSPWNVGNKAAQELLSCVKKKQCTDKYVQDQVIIYMALAEGTSILQTGELTLHTKTAIYVAELMTGTKFETSETINPGTYILKCKGIGILNKLL